MSGSRAAIRYAKAVLDLASGAESSKVYEEIKAVKNIIDENRELQLMLKSPIIKNQDKLAVLKEIFSDKSLVVRNLIETLVSNKRAQLLPAVTENFIRLYNKKEGVVEAYVTTAVSLTDEMEGKVHSKVKELTGASEVALINKVDPAIIGGFILRIGDIQYDASISNNFNKLKKEFSKSI